MAIAAGIGTLLALVPSAISVSAHTAESGVTHLSLREALAAWSFEPLVIIGLAIGAVWYAVGLRSRRSVPGISRVLPAWRIACYYGGLFTLFLALISPVGELSGRFFFVHMTQHQLLQMVAAPLILLGQPLVPLLWALPEDGPRRRLSQLMHASSWVRRTASWLAYPLIAWALFVVALWMWHAPALYDAALRSEWIHNLQHTIFMATALLFWWPLIHPSGGRRQLPLIAGVPYLLVATIQNSVLGALITFAESPLYPTYTELPSLWGFTALADQQLGGVIMWVGGGMMFVAAAALVFAIYVMGEERREEEEQARQGLAGSVGAPSDSAVVGDQVLPKEYRGGAK